VLSLLLPGRVGQEVDKRGPWLPEH
jgi:hypothetical protein